MLKNSWLFICLMVTFSPQVLAQTDLSEKAQAIYQYNRSTVFNEQEEDLNDQGYIEDMQEAEVQDVPGTPEPLQGVATDCKETSDHTEECKDITIVN